MGKRDVVSTHSFELQGRRKLERWRRSKIKVNLSFVMATKVSPLEAVFILAANFAHTLIEVKDIDQVSIMVQDYNEFFNKGNYQKPYQGFLKAFVNLNLPKD